MSTSEHATSTATNPQRLAEWNWPAEDLSASPELQRVVVQSERIERGLGALIAEGPRLLTRGQLEGRWVHRIGLTSTQEPSLVVKTATQTMQLAAERLASYGDYHCYSYRLELPTTEQGQWVDYEITYVKADGAAETEQYRFWQAGEAALVRLQGTSCNGVMRTEDLPALGAGQNWRKALEEHLEHAPVSAHLGLGDNLYADGIVGTPEENRDKVGMGRDGVFNLPTVKAWFAEKDARIKALGCFPKEQQLTEAWNFPVPEAMKQELDEFYLHQYVQHNNTPFYRDFLASTLSINIPDDHDSYDGRGSRPQYIYDSPVLQAIRASADEFYRIYQRQISKTDEPDAAVFFGASKQHSLHLMQANSVAIAALDSRAERTLQQVISEQDWQELFARLRALPEECKRVVITSAAPFTWPRLTLIDDAIIAFYGKDQYGANMLKDDDHDAWFSHVKERDHVLSCLQEIAQEKGLLITSMAGDVHAGAFSRISPNFWAPKVAGPDYRVIEEVVTSPMTNEPMPKWYVWFIRNAGRLGRTLLRGKAQMRFRELWDPSNAKSKLSAIDRRNWALLELEKDGSGLAKYFLEPEDGSLTQFTQLQAALYHPLQPESEGCCSAC